MLYQNLTKIQSSKHEKSHTRPFKYPKATCPYEGAQLRKDLDRHIQTRHPKRVLNAVKYYCSVENCKYSEQGGETFGRLDHLTKHMKSKYP